MRRRTTVIAPTCSSSTVRKSRPTSWPASSKSSSTPKRLSPSSTSLRQFSGKSQFLDSNPVFSLRTIKRILHQSSKPPLSLRSRPCRKVKLGVRQRWPVPTMLTVHFSSELNKLTQILTFTSCYAFCFQQIVHVQINFNHKTPLHC